MRILGIETSFDETAVAILEKKNNSVTLLSNVLASSLKLHIKTGGVIPETAAREQIKYILPVINSALSEAKMEEKEIDAIAVTYGPGLIGSLLVGVETAKTLSYIWNKPLIPVNHLIGHIYANWIETPTYKPQTITFPLIALVVSGGHTDLVLMKDHEKIQWLGGTRDDAAGEAFDKIGRLMGLPYPAGPTIEKRAKEGNPKTYKFPRPMIGSGDFDFSFSGLKTAAFNQIKGVSELNDKTIDDICASTQEAITDVLVRKTFKAAEKYNVKSILLSGGVAANQTLRDQFELKANRYQLQANVFVPEKFLCTDNGAMIAAAAFYNTKEASWSTLTANPELYFD